MLSHTRQPIPEAASYTLRFIYSGLIMEQEALDFHAPNMMKMLASGYRHSNLIFKHGGGRFRLCTLKLSDGHNGHRVLFGIFNGKQISPELLDGDYLVHLDNIWFHDYRKSASFFDEQELNNHIARNQHKLVSCVHTPDQLLKWFNHQLSGENQALQLAETKIEWLPMFKVNRTLLTLSNDQAQALNTELPAVLTGPGGAGKTLLLLATMVTFIEQLPQNPDKPVRIQCVTVGDELSKKTRSCWSRMHHSGEEKGVQVDFTTYRDLCTLMLESDTDKPEWQLATPDTFFTWFKTFHAQQQKHNSDTLEKKINGNKKRHKPTYIPLTQQQIEDVFEELQWVALKNYQPDLAVGEKRNLFTDSNDKLYLQMVFKKYNEHLVSKKLVQPEWYRFKIDEQNKYDLQLIDEGEGFAPVPLLNLMDMVKDNCRLSVFDTRQSLGSLIPVRPWFAEEEQRRANRHNVNLTLPVTKRCSSAVVQSLNKFLQITDWTTGGHTEKFEYSQVIEESERQGDTLFFTGQNAVTAWKDKFANLQDRSQVVILTREQDVELAKSLFDTQNVTTVTRFRGLERQIVVLFNLFSDDVYAEINKHVASMPKDMTKQFGRACDMTNNRLFARACRIIITAMERSIETLCIVQNEKNTHRIALILDAIKPAQQQPQPIVEEPVLSAEEKLKRWELTVNEYLEHGLMQEAREIYQRELMPARGPWETNPACAVLETPLQQPIARKSVTKPVLTQTEIEGFTQAKWLQLFGLRDRNKAYRILLQSPYKNHGCALEAVCSNEKTGKILIGALKKNHAFAREFANLLHKYFHNGFTLAFIDEIGSKVNLSPSTLINSPTGIELLWCLQSISRSINLSSTWLGGAYPDLLNQLFQKAHSDLAAVEWLNYAINSSKECRKQCMDINVFTAFDQLMVNTAGKALLINLLKYTLHAQNKPLLTQFLLQQEQTGERIRWNLLTSNAANHTLLIECIRRCQPDFTRELLNIPNEALYQLLKPLFNSTAGLTCLVAIHDVDASHFSAVCLVPMEFWLLKNEKGESALNYAATCQPLKNLIHDYFCYSSKNRERMYLPGEDVQQSVMRNFIATASFLIFINTIYENLQPEHKELFICNMLNIVLNDVKIKNNVDSDEWANLLGYLFTHYFDHICRYQINNQNVVSWLLVMKQEKLLITILERYDDYRWIFNLHDKQNRCAIDIAFQMNCILFLYVFIDKKELNNELHKWHGPHVDNAFMTWISFDKIMKNNGLSKLTENIEQFGEVLLASCFLNKNLLFHIMRHESKGTCFIKQLCQPVNGPWLISVMKYIMTQLHTQNKSLLGLAMDGNPNRGLLLVSVLSTAIERHHNKTTVFFQKRHELIEKDIQLYVESLRHNGKNIAVFCELAQTSGLKDVFLNSPILANLKSVIKSVAQNFSGELEQRIFLALVSWKKADSLLNRLFHNSTQTNKRKEITALKPDFLTQTVNNSASVFYSLTLSNIRQSILRQIFIANESLLPTIASRKYLCETLADERTALKNLAENSANHYLLLSLFQSSPELVQELMPQDLFSTSSKDGTGQLEPSVFSFLLITTQGQTLLKLLLQSKVSLVDFREFSYVLTTLPEQGCNVLDYLINYSAETQQILYMICQFQKQFFHLFSWGLLNRSVQIQGVEYNCLRSLLQNWTGFDLFISMITLNQEFLCEVSWENLTSPLEGDLLQLSVLHYIVINCPKPGCWESYLLDIIEQCPQLVSDEAITCLESTFIDNQSIWDLMHETEEGTEIADKLLSMVADNNPVTPLEDLLPQKLTLT